MSLWAIIPVKPLRRSKSRLSEVLSEDERTQLNAQMLENTLKVLRSVTQIKEILIISRDTSVLALARSYGAKTLQEDGGAGLNLALKRAVLVAKAYSAQSILILPMDIPFLSKEDVLSLIQPFHISPGVVIAPDRHKNGTNAILVSPPELIDFSYGPGSFERHIWQAQAKGAAIEVVQIESTGFDLDDPTDLALYKKIQTYESDFSENKKMEDKHV